MDRQMGCGDAVDIICHDFAIHSTRKCELRFFLNQILICIIPTQ